MTSDNESVHPFPSTKWEWKLCKVKAAPAQGSQHPKDSTRAFRVQKREIRAWMTVRIRYQGGADASYAVEARGRCWRFSGVSALHDVMTFIASEEWNRAQPNRTSKRTTRATGGSSLGAD